MLLIFGMRNRAHQHGPCVAANCPRCHNEVVLAYLVVTRWFTLFFVPLIPFGRRRMLVCPICSWRREVSKSSEHLALEMIDITGQWKAHQLGDAEYAQRVEAFWSFVSQDPTVAAPSDQTPSDQTRSDQTPGGQAPGAQEPGGPPGPSQAPPAPPVPPGP